jgi:hypothetical protein
MDSDIPKLERLPIEAVLQAPLNITPKVKKTPVDEPSRQTPLTGSFSAPITPGDLTTSRWAAQVSSPSVLPSDAPSAPKSNEGGCTTASSAAGGIMTSRWAPSTEVMEGMDEGRGRAYNVAQNFRFPAPMDRNSGGQTSDIASFTSQEGGRGRFTSSQHAENSENRPSQSSGRSQHHTIEQAQSNLADRAMGHFTSPNRPVHRRRDSLSGGILDEFARSYQSEHALTSRASPVLRSLGTQEVNMTESAPSSSPLNRFGRHDQWGVVPFTQTTQHAQESENNNPNLTGYPLIDLSNQPPVRPKLDPLWESEETL